MTNPLDSANVYTDLQGLDQLRLSANKNDPKALEAVAKQFEALFIQQMLKSMREASLAPGAFDSQEGHLYLDMFDKQISLIMAQGKGMGLADILVKQLRSTSQQVANLQQKHDQMLTRGQKAQPVSALQPASAKGQSQVSQLKPASIAEPTSTTVVTAPDTSAKTLVTHTDFEKSEFSTPEAFVQALWPLAQQAGQQLGVAPKVLLAQAALETGWGKGIIKDANGHSSYNLFGIKSGVSWPGMSISVPTLEFHNDIPVREKAQFRAYAGYAESFQDYVQLIQSSPRYYMALQQASDPLQYTRALQQAGYATDPEYSNKIMGIFSGSPMQQALDRIKLSSGRTITNEGRS